MPFGLKTSSDNGYTPLSVRSMNLGSHAASITRILRALKGIRSMLLVDEVLQQGKSIRNYTPSRICSAREDVCDQTETRN